MAITIRAFTKLLGPLKRRVLLMIGRGILNLIDDAPGVQRVQLTALQGETLDGVERFQEYGFTSVPHPGAEAVIAAAAGDRSHSIIVAVEDRRYRLTGMTGGEVAVHDDQGQIIKLARDRIAVTTPFDLAVNVGGNINMTAGGNFAVRAQRIDLN